MANSRVGKPDCLSGHQGRPPYKSTSFSTVSLFSLCLMKKREITTRCLHRQHSYGRYAKKWSAAVWSLFCELQSQNYVLFQESVVLSRAVLPLDWVDTIKEALITQCLFHTLIVCSAKWNRDFVRLWSFVLRVNLKPIPLLDLQCCRDFCSNSQN